MPTLCKYCEGRGELQPGVPCIRCRGKGKIFSKKEREVIDFMNGMMKACNEVEQIRQRMEQNAAPADGKKQACRRSLS